MKKAIFFTVIILLGCQNDSKIVLASSGNLNEVSVVIENDLWEGAVGKELKTAFSKPIYGLPQQEKQFILRQMPPGIFSGFATKSRVIIKIESNKKKGINVVSNKYASPQKIIVISGANANQIIQQIRSKTKEIFSILRNSEIREKKRRIKKSLSSSSSLKKVFNITLDYPSIYREASVLENFVWLRKDTKSGSVNLSIFEAPLTRDKLSKQKIIAIRDSVAKTTIPGPTLGTYMTTDPEYRAVSKPIIINKKTGMETRGLWEVKKQFMGGPFINFSIVDSTNRRILYFDGFVYSPGTAKADYIFELEAIIKSLKILK